MDRALTLREAIALLRDVLDDLDTSATACTECDKPHYNNFDDWRIANQLSGVIEKLSNTAERIPARRGKGRTHEEISKKHPGDY